MNSYMVFTGRKWESVMGNRRGINWNHEQAILGVFHAETPEEACKAAAIKAGFAGTFFAVEGFAWGIDLYESDVTEYGAGKPQEDRLDKLERLVEQGMRQLTSPTAKEEEN